MEIIRKGLKKFSQVCIGEVFCFVSNADYTYCPLLCLRGGVVDLDDNYFIPESQFPNSFGSDFEDKEVIVYNAKLILG